MGIASADDLRACGAAVAFLRVEQAGYGPSRNLLWALQGALTDRHWSDITPKEKEALEAEVATLRDGS